MKKRFILLKEFTILFVLFIFFTFVAFIIYIYTYRQNYLSLTHSKVYPSLVFIRLCCSSVLCIL